MEICDVYDESGQHTGQRVARGTRLQAGHYYLAVNIWIRNESGEYLIQQRALHLKSAPGIWATTVGYVIAGEESLAGAIREVMEELNLQLSPVQLRHFDRFRTPPRIEDVWMADILSNAMGPEAGEDVADWKWASKEEIRQMIRDGVFFAYSYFDQLPE